MSRNYQGQVPGCSGVTGEGFDLAIGLGKPPFQFLQIQLQNRHRLGLQVEAVTNVWMYFTDKTQG